MDQSEADPAESLQFDHAEYTGADTGRLTCAVCNQEVAATYYEINGKTVCDGCQVLLSSQRSSGFGVLHFARASLFGAGAAVAGALLYFGVVWLTNYEFGLMSVVLGFMVGGAVRAGSKQRGGLAYQLLALFLTYSAIVASYVGLALTALGSDVEAEDAPANQAAVRADAEPKKGDEPAAHKAVQTPEPGPNPAGDAPELSDAKADKPANEPVKPDQAPVPAAENPVPDAAENPVPLNLATLFALLVLFYKIPIDANLSSPIGLLIIAFALWEAWKLNRHVPLVFNGPFMFAGKDESENATPATGPQSDD